MSQTLFQKTPPLGDYLASAGRTEATSSWIEITQEMIDRFADVTNDHQFIHVDPVRAKAETPFGGTIAHGFLTLSLLSAMANEAVALPAETVMGINYGFDKIRFLSPVPCGSRVRGRFRLAAAKERKPRELLSQFDVAVEIEGSETPALVAEWLTVAMLSASVAELTGTKA